MTLNISGKAMAEDNPVETPKRKRGRPPKPESEKAAPKRKAESDSAAPAKRGRGRPPGSKNKGSAAAKKPASKGTVRGTFVYSCGFCISVSHLQVIVWGCPSITALPNILLTPS